MSTNIDIRWEQRFSNYRKALKQMTKAIDLIKVDKSFDVDDIKKSDILDIIKEGLIQRFEYTHELALNVIKDYSEYQGNTSIRGSRDSTREGFKMRLITEAEKWMDMIKSRNGTSHTYNKETAEEIVELIINDYYDLFLKFEKVMEQLKTGIKKTIFDNEL